MMDLMEISFPNLGIDLKYVPKRVYCFRIYHCDLRNLYRYCGHLRISDGSEGGKEDRTESGHLFLTLQSMR